jgi:DNA topoisomerase-1
MNGARPLGNDSVTGLPVSLRKGPYGYYVQLGESADNETAADESGRDDENAKTRKKAKRKAKRKVATEANGKPKRISLPRDIDPETVDLEKALALLSLPRTLGTHPETGQAIIAGLGRFGPYLRAGDAYVSLRGDDDVLTIGLNRAIDLLAKARPGKAKGRSLGEHPADGKPVLLKAGRYGPYIEHGQMRATLPAGTDAEGVDLERAVALLDAKAGRTGAKPATRGRRAAPVKRASRTDTGTAAEPEQTKRKPA